MAKVRAYGADSTLRACREPTYGVAPASGYRSLDFKTADLSAEHPLGDDPLLGRGRNAQDGEPAQVTPEAVDALLDLWPMAEAFERFYLAPALLLDEEKND